MLKPLQKELQPVQLLQASYYKASVSTPIGTSTLEGTWSAFHYQFMQLLCIKERDEQDTNEVDKDR